MTVLVEKNAVTLEDGIKTLIESAITDYKKRYGDGLNTDLVNLSVASASPVAVVSGTELSVGSSLENKFLMMPWLDSSRHRIASPDKKSLSFCKKPCVA